MFASILGRAEVVKGWCARFPTWDLNRTGPMGGTALSYGCQFGPDKLETVKALVEAGADTARRMDTGSHLLIQCAANPDCDPAFVAYVLSLKGVRDNDLVNAPMRPRTRSWAIKYRLVRLFVWLGAKRAVLKSVSAWHKQTSLGSAVRNGNLIVARALVAGGADRTRKNAQGDTPLQQARTHYGTDLPESVATLLEPIEIRSTPRVGTAKATSRVFEAFKRV